MRQLVVGEPDGRSAKQLEDLIERVGVDGRGEAVTDRGRPDRDPCRQAPGVGGQMVGELVGEDDRRLGADRFRAGGPTRATGPAELRCLRQPGERLRLAGELDLVDGRRQEVKERAQQCGLAGPLCLGSDDERDARLDEHPELRRQLRIERAGPDQLDDRPGFGWGGSERPTPTSRRDVGHLRSVPARVRDGQREPSHPP